MTWQLLLLSKSISLPDPPPTSWPQPLYTLNDVFHPLFLCWALPPHSFVLSFLHIVYLHAVSLYFRPSLLVWMATKWTWLMFLAVIPSLSICITQTMAQDISDKAICMAGFEWVRGILILNLMLWFTDIVCIMASVFLVKSYNSLYQTPCDVAGTLSSAYNVTS